jgi:hypothetical protein
MSKPFTAENAEDAESFLSNNTSTFFSVPALLHSPGC